MKKSTLISTLAMVVIVALALTTATFAWYTANSSVTATTNATAATANGSNLSIAKGTTPGTASTVDCSNTVQMKPLVPTEALVKTTDDAGTKLSDLSLWGSTIGVATVDAGETTYQWTGTKYPGDTTNYFTQELTITNQSKDETDASAVSIKMDVNWSEMEASLDGTTLTDTEKASDENKTAVKNALRIAVFTGSGNEAELIALLANTGGVVHYGDKEDVEADSITASTVAEVAATSIATTTDATGIASLKGQGSQVLTIVMWFDGVALTQQLSGAAITNIVFTFDIDA